MEENMITEGLRKLVTLASQCALIRLQQDYHGSDLISNPTRGKIYEGFEEVQIKQPINSKSYLPRRCDRKDGVFCKSSSTHPKSQAIFQQADRQSLPGPRRIHCHLLIHRSQPWKHRVKHHHLLQNLVPKTQTFSSWWVFFPTPFEKNMRKKY